MKRYLAFGGDFYYPRGGWDDFAGDFATFEEATKKLSEQTPEKVYPPVKDSPTTWGRRGFTVPARRRYEWAHVVDSQTCELTIVKS